MKELLFIGKLDLLFYNLIRIYKENETIWIKIWLKYVALQLFNTIHIFERECHQNKTFFYKHSAFMASGSSAPKIPAWWIF